MLLLLNLTMVRMDVILLLVVMWYCRLGLRLNFV